MEFCENCDKGKLHSRALFPTGMYYWFCRNLDFQFGKLITTKITDFSGLVFNIKVEQIIHIYVFRMFTLIPLIIT